jgi:hypothetical protein
MLFFPSSTRTLLTLSITEINLKQICTLCQKRKFAEKRLNRRFSLIADFHQLTAQWALEIFENRSSPAYQLPNLAGGKQLESFEKRVKIVTG